MTDGNWDNPGFDSVSEAANEAIANIAKSYDKPTLTVLGVFRGGKVVQVEWSGRHVSLSDRTLAACQVLGIDIIDEAENYLFTGEVI